MKNQPQQNSFKYAFFGTPEIARATVEILNESGFPPSLIVTNADKPVGRKHVLTMSPVKSWAVEHDIPVIDNENIPEVLEVLSKESWDAFIVVAYGHILPETLINLPSHGTLNIHYSLLPRHRGASPVEAAILSGDEITGVTIQQMVYKLDAGAVIAQSSIELEGDETTPELKEIMATMGGELLADVLPEWLNQDITPEVQDESLVTKSGKFKKEDMEIRDDMDEITKWRTYRALIERKPYFIQHGVRNIITDAEFSNGKFVIKEIIPEGKERMLYYGN